jgi:hypothetical protein
MPKQKKSADIPLRSYGQNKRPKTFRFTPETIDKLKKATIKNGVSETVYVELALKDRFKKDGIA